MEQDVIKDLENEIEMLQKKLQQEEDQDEREWMKSNLSSLKKIKRFHSMSFEDLEKEIEEIEEDLEYYESYPERDPFGIRVEILQNELEIAEILLQKE